MTVRIDRLPSGTDRKHRQPLYGIFYGLVMLITFISPRALAQTDAPGDIKALIIDSTVTETIRKTGMVVDEYYSDDGNIYARAKIKGAYRSFIIPYYFKENKLCQKVRGPEVCVRLEKQGDHYVTIHDSGKIGSDIQIAEGDVYDLVSYAKQRK